MRKRGLKISVLILCTVLTAGSLSACGISSLTAKDFKLNKDSYTMEVGDNVTLSPEVDGDPNKNSYQWESSNPKVAVVHDDGTVHALKDGETKVTATDNHGKSASCDITVEKTEIETISLSRQSATIKKGKGLSLTAQITPSDADESELQWSSSNESVALVNSSGYVTGGRKRQCQYSL